MFLHPPSVSENFNISEGMKVADFGSGHGHFTIPIARKVGSYGRVYAIDLVSDSLDQLRSEAHGEGMAHVQFIQGNIEKERGSFLADRSVDRVLLINTLFTLDNKEAALREVVRVLSPKGYLALIDWKDSFDHIGPHPDHIIGEERARSMALGNGFRIKKEFDAGDMHYGFLFALSSPETV